MPKQPRREQPPPEPEPAADRADYERQLELLAAENQSHRQGLARRFEPVLNAYLQTQAPENAGQKKELAQRVSADLKRLGLAIRHPETDQPCTLMTAAGKANRLGFFLLKPKGARKAVAVRASLSDLLPLQLMPDTPRREPLAEWRARGRKDGGQGPPRRP
jgi:hypothetical protein